MGETETKPVESPSDVNKEDEKQKLPQQEISENEKKRLAVEKSKRYQANTIVAIQLPKEEKAHNQKKNASNKDTSSKPAGNNLNKQQPNNNKTTSKPLPHNLKRIPKEEQGHNQKKENAKKVSKLPEGEARHNEKRDQVVQKKPEN